MKSSSSGRDLQSLLEAVKASDVVENRVQLLTELEELHIAEKSEVASLLKSLNIFWEDFTCLDISQCMLNKTILHVAAKQLEADISGFLEQFIGLGTKASIWCRKHLKMTLMSTEESPEEEHSGFFYQLLFDSLSFSAASFSALAKYPISGNKELMIMVENFIMEQLNLTKDLLMEIKRIHSLGSELQKQGHVILDSALRLCKVYSTSMNWDLYFKEDKKIAGSEEADSVYHVINVIKCTIEKLCELGILAANDGGSLVSVLNLSWKGVVTLLQLGKGALAVKVDVAGIIVTLISLAKESLRCAAGNWSTSLKDVSVAEAKRIFLPVKFYLINAVRIITQYPSQAFSVHKEITLCVIMIATFRISLSKDELLRSGCEALAETLEPTSLHLLNSLINSAQVKKEQKFQILDCLFSYEPDVNSVNESLISNHGFNSMDTIFSVTPDSMGGVRKLLCGRVILFLNLLKSAPDLEEDVRLGMARKLGWVFDVIVDQDVYSFVLQIPALCGSNQSQELVHQPMMYLILQALKTFMIVVYSTQAWEEVESFLLENFFHPHCICSEIVTELWSFILRHADTDFVNDIFDKLCSLLRCITSPESVVNPGSALRRIARSICMLVTYGSRSIADRVYNSIFSNNKSHCSSSLYAALLMEGFPLNFLSEKTRSIAKQRIVTEYFDFVEKFDNILPKASGFDGYGSPVFCLSAALQSHQVSVSDTDMKTLKLLVAISRKYKNAEDKTLKDQYRRLLSETLGIISNLKHLYSSDGIDEVILELQNVFISKPALSDSQSFQCKPNLTYFMAGLGHVELTDSEDNARTSAVWELYHMLLRERHWAFIHLAVSAFGYFAERTSCNQLWRFVPQDAALSFDLESGREIDEERFMSELKAFLEKEMARLSMKPSPDQHEMLVKEGSVLKEVVKKAMNIVTEANICDVMEIDGEKQANRKRKLPDEISKGVELLQSGLKVMSSGLSRWQCSQVDSPEIHEKLMTHFVHLEDVIAHLVSLADNG